MERRNYHYSTGPYKPPLDTDVTIDSNATAIIGGMFEGYNFLSTITMPPSITTIADRAFYGCTALPTVALSPKITTIGRYAFYGCESLSSITIQSTNIEKSFVSDSDTLSAPKIPPSSIGRCAFAKCTSLSTVTIPPNIKFIDDTAFFGCTHLRSIEVNSSLLVIKKDRRHPGDHGIERINDKLGTLFDVLKQKSFSPISKELYIRLGMGKNIRFTFYGGTWIADYDAFVHWRKYSLKQQQEPTGRLPLFTALEKGVLWSEGLCDIVKGYGAAIETTDVVTCLEAFMLAAIGTNSNLETIYHLLLDHPAAIHPYVQDKQY